MSCNVRYITFLLCGMLMLLSTSCGGSEGGGDDPSPENQPKLLIHIYTPGHPIVTRADVGDVSGDEEEQAIHKLQIWVFESETGNKVGYLDAPTAELRDTTGGNAYSGTFQLVISNSFASAPVPVDVYVLANTTASQIGLSGTGVDGTLDGNTSRAILKDALLKKRSADNDPFGLTTLTESVPSTGLPMSGVLTNQTLGGLSPVLSVTDPVTVVRTMSKVRFIFSRAKSGEEEKTLKINSVTLDGGLIPLGEYLFLSRPYAAGASRIEKQYTTEENNYLNYEQNPRLLVSASDQEIAVSESPARYAYVAHMTGQEYENLINDSLSRTDPLKPTLTQLGKFYFRESDRKMAGEINYTIGEGEGASTKTARFSMASEGDFSRNHTWIVYGYYAGSDNLEVVSVKVEAWNLVDNNDKIYNW